MTLTIPSRSANEAFARMAVAAFVAQLDPTVEELCDIKTAVSEAVTNCIVHAYRDTIGRIYIQGRIDDRRITVRIRDKGCGIPDVEKAMEPLFTTGTGAEERAGLGFAVMQAMMDRVKVTSAVGKGTTVLLQKRLSDRGDGDDRKDRP
ncbi:MAG TPA: anti-sigma F factor [Firmicutes bacterium]|nr:anti-sigma F factor [Bacillota bacterium]